MNAIVFEHVPIADLPPAWRDKLALMTEQRVTVRIEAENDVLGNTPSAIDLTDNPLFGMWRDRDDMADVAGYVRAARAPRFGQPESGDAD